MTDKDTVGNLSSGNLFAHNVMEEGRYDILEKGENAVLNRYCDRLPDHKLQQRTLTITYLI